MKIFVLIFFSVFRSYSASSNRYIFTVSCPTGFNLLSCGTSNYVQNYVEKYRYSKPISNTECECYDYYGINCHAWCTTLPLPKFEIMKSTSSNVFTSKCSSGNNVMGCHIKATTSSSESGRRYFPLTDGSGCTCYDYFGAECIATCMPSINNHEVVISPWSSGNVVVACNNPNNRVLGCGVDPYGPSNGIERYRTQRPISGNSCECYDRAGTYCFAVCGSIWP